MVNLMRGKLHIELGDQQLIIFFTLYALIQKYLSKRKGRFYCTFVDFSRAFDSIPHVVLSPNLRRGLKQNLVAKSGILGFLILFGRFSYEKKY